MTFRTEPNIIVLSELPSTLRLNLKGQTGALIAAERSLKKDPQEFLIINESDLEVDRINRQLITELNKNKISLVRNITSTIPVVLDSLITKKVKIFNQTSSTAMNGFTITQTKLNPSNINISGPASFIYHIDSLPTGKSLYQKLNLTLTDSVHVMKSISDLIKLQDEKVEITITVKPLEIQTITIYPNKLFKNTILTDSIKLKIEAPQNYNVDVNAFQFSELGDQSSHTSTKITSLDPLVKIISIIPL